MKFYQLLIFLFFICNSTFAQAQSQSPFKRGAGDFIYNLYEPLKNKPITVFYYIPTKGDIKNMKVLFSMHGAERNGLIQRGVWRNIAEKYGFIVIAPQFKHTDGYLENDYQFGGVSEHPKDFKQRPQEQWTYQIIENLFDYFILHTGSAAKTYDMFGHSAGGQFVHRYLLMTPNARIGKAVAGNPGNYTYPDDKGIFSESGKLAIPGGWPYSFKGTNFYTKDRLAAFYSKKLTICIGALDTANTESKKNMVETNPSLIQGKNRYIRAINYFEFNKAAAAKANLPFNWKLLVVPGAAHSSAQIIYGNGNINAERIDNGEKVYDLKQLNNKGAYMILIK